MKNSRRIFIFVIMILATTVGIYGQIISYYISKNIIEISPLHCLTILTAITIFLFLTSHTMIYRSIKKEKIKGNLITLSLIINSLMGIPVSFFSIFVLLMWWS